MSGDEIKAQAGGAGVKRIRTSEDLEELLEAKNKELLESKQETIASMKELNAVLKNDLEEKTRELAVINQQLLAANAKTQGIVCVRALIELGARALYPAVTATQAVQNVVAAGNLLNGNKLQQDAENDLTALEGNALEKQGVASELKDMYHELSKEIHHPDLGENGTGLYCGGRLPSRAAAAIMILELQRKNQLRFDVKYCDEHFHVKKTLRGGNVLP